VEEFVLLANVSITKKIDEVFPDGCPEMPSTPAKDAFRELPGRAFETQRDQA